MNAWIGHYIIRDEDSIMIPTEVRHEFEKEPPLPKFYQKVQLYRCKHCGRTTAHPELDDKFPDICQSKNRRKDIRRSVDR